MVASIQHWGASLRFSTTDGRGSLACRRTITAIAVTFGMSVGMFPNGGRPVSAKYSVAPTVDVGRGDRMFAAVPLLGGHVLGCAEDLETPRDRLTDRFAGRAEGFAEAQVHEPSAVAFADPSPT